MADDYRRIELITGEEAAVEETLALCNGDARAAVRALHGIIADLEQELAIHRACASSGFTRQWRRSQARA